MLERPWSLVDWLRHGQEEREVRVQRGRLPEPRNLGRGWIIVVALASFLLPCCNLGVPIDRRTVQIDFALLNAAGGRINTFTVGDSIIVHATISNLSGERLIYQFTGVPVVLSITSGDSVVATSVDGLIFAQLVQGGVLEIGQSMTYDWRAPNTPWNARSMILLPGVFQVEAIGGFFTSFPWMKPESIQFTVYPGNV